MFNAVRYIKSLEAVGIPREQAEAQVQLIIAAIEDEVATKTELTEFRSETKSEISNVRAEVAQLRAEMNVGFAQMKSELVFKLGALFVGFNTVGFGMLGILFAFVGHH